MANLMEENPKLVIVLVVAVAAGSFGIKSLLNKRQSEQQALVEQVASGGTSPQAQSDRLREINRIRYKDPVGALTMLDGIVATPVNDAEALRSQELHPQLMRSVVQLHLKEKAWDPAMEMIERLADQYPDSESLGFARKDWSRSRSEAMSVLISSGRLDEAHAIALGLSKRGWVSSAANAFTALQEALMKDWVASGGGLEHERLLQAAGILPELSRQAPFSRHLNESSVSGEAIQKQADALFGSPDPFGAFGFYSTALLRLNDNRKPWKAEGEALDFAARTQLRRSIESRFAQLQLKIGNALHGGERVLITAETGEDILRDAARNFQNQDLKAPLFRRLVEIQTARLMTLSDPLMETGLVFLADPANVPNERHNTLNKQIRECSSLADQIRKRSGRQLWASLVADTNFNPYPLLPEAIRMEMENRRAKGTRELSLRQSIASMAGKEGFPIPLDMLKPVRQRHAEVNARRGFLTFDVQPVSCVMWLKQALADLEEEALRSEIIEATGEALLNSQGSDQFLAFYELTGFLVSDIGVDKLPEGKRGAFLKGLSDVAAGLAGKGEMPKSIFLGAIKAEAVGVEGAGQTLANEVIADAYGQVSGVPVEEIPATGLVPSGLENLSVLSIDNSTEHHLLVFYRGPESFFLACRPHRKVSAVLKDGDYEIAVIAPSGAISPYHGKTSLSEARQQSNYTLRRSGEDSERFGSYGSAASGVYTLARVPEGEGPFAIDGRTGAVSMK